MEVEEEHRGFDAVGVLSVLALVVADRDVPDDDAVVPWKLASSFKGSAYRDNVVESDIPLITGFDSPPCIPSVCVHEDSV